VQASRPSKNYYKASLEVPRPHIGLMGNIKTDVCVIGGGFTGVSAALHLATAGARVLLIEAQTIGYGASGRNGGQIHTGLRQNQQSLERWLGKGHARQLWDLSEESKALVRELVTRYEIDCSMKDGLIIAADDKGAVKPLAEDTAYLQTHYGYAQARMLSHSESVAMLGTAVYPAARFDAGGGHMQPLAFVRGMSRAAETAGVHIYEKTRARRIESNHRGARIVCDTGAIDAGHVILACDALSADIVPELAPYIAHVESFMTATTPLDEDLYAAILPSNAAVADTRHVLDYYRKSADRRMLFAGRESYLTVPKDVASVVRPRMERVYPALKNIPIEFAWRGTVGVTRTRMPHFGRLSPRTVFAHGYSGQGVALANLAGKILAEAVLGRPERFDVFASVPAQRFPGGAWMRKPLVAAGLIGFRILDLF
jgi:gamma-glutamylputrescine oxidase